MAKKVKKKELKVKKTVKKKSSNLDVLGIIAIVAIVVIAILVINLKGKDIIKTEIIKEAEPSAEEQYCLSITERCFNTGKNTEECVGVINKDPICKKLGEVKDKFANIGGQAIGGSGSSSSTCNWACWICCLGGWEPSKRQTECRKGSHGCSCYAC